MTGSFARVPITAARVRLGARAHRVLIAIAAHADRQGQAFPSLATIAEKTGIERRGLHREITALVTAGLLRVEPRRDEAGDAASNLYTVIYDAVSSQVTTPVASSDDTVSSQVTTSGVVSKDDLTDQYGTDQRTRAPRASRARVPVSLDGASEFETFWQAYPSRQPHGNPRKPAREAFEAAIKRGIDPNAIIRGAENFAAHVRQSGTEPRFIPHASSWLRQERWQDHQQPPEAPRRRVGML